MTLEKLYVHYCGRKHRYIIKTRSRNHATAKMLTEHSHLLFVCKPPLAEQFVAGQIELFQLFYVFEPGPAAVPTVLVMIIRRPTYTQDENSNIESHANFHE